MSGRGSQSLMLVTVTECFSSCSWVRVSPDLDCAGLSIRGDYDPRATGEALRHGDQHKALGPSATDGYLPANPGDPSLLLLPGRRCRPLRDRRQLPTADACRA